MHISAVAQVIARGMLVGIIGVMLSGCDYWPPALQAQIEQLKTEAQQAASERASVEEQLNAATKVRNDLQSRVEELAKANDQLAARVSALESDLAGERKKVARLAEGAKKAVPTKSAKSAGTTAKTKKKPVATKSAKPSAHRPQRQ